MAKADKNSRDVTGSDEDVKRIVPASGSSSKKSLLIVLAVLALVGVNVVGTMIANSLFSKNEPEKKEVKKDEADDDETDAQAKEREESSDKNPDGTPKAALYLEFEQPFVVNFQDEGQLRYLQVTVSVMTKSPKTIEELKRHMPLIRNNLVMLFSGQTREGIISRDGKEKIRKEAEVEVQKVLKEQTGRPGVKALYFTSFVMQ